MWFFFFFLFFLLLKQRNKRKTIERNRESTIMSTAERDGGLLTSVELLCLMCLPIP